MSSARQLSVSGPFGVDDVSVEHLSGREALGRLFQFEVSLLSRSPDIDLSAVVGDTLTVSIDVAGAQTRYLNGYVTRMALVGTFSGFARYRATLHPWLYIMSSRTNSRIFQKKSVPDIAKALFRDHGFTDFEDGLSHSYPAREFVVQYRESDFNFVSRLLEHAGIYYYFRHEEGRHVLVLADSLANHDSAAGYEDVLFHPEGSPTPGGGESVNHWELAQQWRPGAYASDDFDFTRPKADLSARLTASSGQKKGDLEVYDYPGGYPDQPGGQDYVRARLQALQSDVATGHGRGDVRGIGAGNLFSLVGFPMASQNKSYLVISADYDATNNAHETGAAGAAAGRFDWSFVAIDSKVPFRPLLSTPRPRVEGVQTAIVVGQAGEEIWTDEYGRVKVQFHWDREGKNDENSSCWVRVAQVWAGAKWGAMHIPRIGQEVIVDFLEGDPDRPLITGRVYNRDNMPPYDLPAKQTQSGIKSRSTKGGAPTNFNELRFEDKKGAEQVYLQAEKDLQALVKNDEQRQVGHDRHEQVGNDETVSIGANRTETVGANETITVIANQTLTVGGSRAEGIGQNDLLTVGGSRSESVGKDEDISVGGDRSVSVEKDDSTTVTGKQTFDIGKDQSVTISGGRTLSIAKDDSVTVGGKLAVSIAKDETRQVGKKLLIDVADEVTIKTGDASLVMKKNGDITLKGKNITLDGSGKINVKASGDVIIKGSKVTQN